MKAVILAGGLGTRISEETHLRPKPMIEIGGKPLRCAKPQPFVVVTLAQQRRSHSLENWAISSVLDTV